MLRGKAGNLWFMHIMHHHLVFRARQPVDDFDGVFTDFATRAENFNFVFHESILLVLPLLSLKSAPVGTQAPGW
jgi:hypothetical protein